MTRKNDLDRFYRLMKNLKKQTSGPTVMSKEECEKWDWPTQGVFFGFEHGETRKNGSSRVVWVGTHGDKKGAHTTSWQRFRDHFGYRGGSVLRDYVRDALKVFNEADQISKEDINGHLSKMELLVAYVPGEPSKYTDRVYIKRNSIALLSNYNKPDLDPASDDWLGGYCFSGNGKVKQSGLWNVDHVHEGYNPCFMDRLEEYIRQTPLLEKTV